MLDHRCSQRTDTRIHALLRLNDCWVPAIISNMSEGGFFAETQTQFTPRSLAVVEVQLGRTKGGGHVFPTLVIHRQRNGMGLMAMASEEERLLSDYLRRPQPPIRLQHVSRR